MIAMEIPENFPGNIINIVEFSCFYHRSLRILHFFPKKLAGHCEDRVEYPQVRRLICRTGCEVLDEDRASACTSSLSSSLSESGEEKENHHLDVSKNRGTPKWMVYKGKPY